MSAQNSASEKWLLDRWAEENARTLQSMTDARPSAACELASAAETAGFEPGTTFLEITFTLAPNSVLWVALPPGAAKDLGERTLHAAGIDDAGDEEVQNTCFEILQQVHAGLAQAIGGRMKRGVSSQGREIEQFPAGNPLFRLTISYPEAAPILTFLAVSPALLQNLESPPEAEPPSAAPLSREVLTSESRPLNGAGSKTFEVLLDVSMPVSVSFGRTEMAVKEVLKLTTGSIVELNRSLSEPVEVIINDRVIARGEVVVVDGNYGVRIHHIVSRQERLRSSTQGVTVSRAEQDSGK